LLNPKDEKFDKCTVPQSGFEDMYSKVLHRGGLRGTTVDVDEFEEKGAGSDDPGLDIEALRLSSVAEDSTLVVDLYDSGAGTLDSTDERRRSHCVICVFDVTDADSFTYLQPFPMGFLHQFASLKAAEIPYSYKTFVLVANKVDLLDADVVHEEDMYVDEEKAGELEYETETGGGLADDLDMDTDSDSGDSEVEIELGRKSAAKKSPAKKKPKKSVVVDDSRPKRAVFKETAELFCQEYNWLYYEVSGLSGKGCMDMFGGILREIDRKMANGIEDDPSAESGCCTVL
jgi:GTPase SAR1 family protein